MNQNKAIAFLALLVLGLVYLLFMFLVWITRGKKQALVKQKIRTGIHILFLAGVLSFLSCESCSTPPGTYRLIIYALHGNGEKKPVYSNSLAIS